MFNLFKKLFPSANINRSQAANSSLHSSRNPHQSMLHDGSETATRGQLVQIMMRDLVRKSGIPPGWVQCQIQVVSSRTKGQGIYVRLVVKHWDERLMKYAFAFQKALLTDIVQFEPQAATWLQGIAWQLEVAGSCPVTELPGKLYWQMQQQEEVDQFEIIPMPAPMPAPAPAPAPMLFVPPVAAKPVILQVPELAEEAPAPSTAKPSPYALDPLPALFDERAAQENDAAQDLERLFAIRDRELEQLAIDNLLPAGYEKTKPSPL